MNTVLMATMTDTTTTSVPDSARKSRSGRRLTGKSKRSTITFSTKRPGGRFKAPENEGGLPGAWSTNETAGNATGVSKASIGIIVTGLLVLIVFMKRKSDWRQRGSVFPLLTSQAAQADSSQPGSAVPLPTSTPTPTPTPTPAGSAAWDSYTSMRAILVVVIATLLARAMLAADEEETGSAPSADTGEGSGWMSQGAAILVLFAVPLCMLWIYADLLPKMPAPPVPEIGTELWQSMQNGALSVLAVAVLTFAAYRTGTLAYIAIALMLATGIVALALYTPSMFELPTYFAVASVCWALVLAIASQTGSNWMIAGVVCATVLFGVARTQSRHGARSYLAEFALFGSMLVFGTIAFFSVRMAMRHATSILLCVAKVILLLVVSVTVLVSPLVGAYFGLGDFAVDAVKLLCVAALSMAVIALITGAAIYTAMIYIVTCVVFMLLNMAMSAAGFAQSVPPSASDDTPAPAGTSLDVFLSVNVLALVFGLFFGSINTDGLLFEHEGGYEV